MNKNGKRMLFIAVGVWLFLVGIAAYCLLFAFPNAHPAKPAIAPVATSVPVKEAPPRDLTIVGVGVLMIRNDRGKFEITRVFPNSPAEKVGLAKGMLVTKIGDVIAETKPRGQLFKLLLGPVGSKVNLEVCDNAGDNARTVEIIRQPFLNRSGKTNADSQTPANN